MSITAGVWNETALQNVRLAAAGLMDDRIALQYRPKSTQTMEFIRDMQTAEVTPLKGKKENTVELSWINACGLSVEDNVGCEFGTTELSTNTEEKTLSKNKTVKWLVDENEYKTNDYDYAQVVAKGIMRADALIVEDICAYGVAQLNTFAGENQLDDTTEKFTNNSTTIEMAAAYWNASAIATLMRVGAVNRFTNPMALSGSLLHEAALNASWDGGNADGKGGIRRFTDFPIRFDELNVDTVNSGTKYLYLASTGSLAFASRTDYDDSIRVFDWGRGVRFESMFMPGLYYDLITKDECSGDVNKKSFKLVCKYDIFNNPSGCTDGNTGVVKFKCT